MLLQGHDEEVDVPVAAAAAPLDIGANGYKAAPQDRTQGKNISRRGAVVFFLIGAVVGMFTGQVR